MERCACVDVFRFPLQLVLAATPEWVDEPVAVLDRSGPEGRLVHLNRRAADRGLDSGMRFGQACGLVPDLRADTVDAAELNRHSDQIAETLGDFSPRIERDDHRPGVFWVDVTGLKSLYDRWRRWVDPLRRRLRDDHGVYVAVVIGFTRFGTFAVARSTGRCGMFESRHSERRAAERVPLDRLDLDDAAVDTAKKLGLATVDDLLQLPAEGLRRRLGEQAYALYRRAHGELNTPRPAVRPDDAPAGTDRFDRAETNRDRLLFRIKRRLHTLVDALEADGEKVATLSLTLHRGDAEPIDTEIRPAAPTVDTALLADLLRLKLEGIPVDGGITEVTVVAHGQRTTTEQMRLFGAEPARDRDAANRALAQLRTEFGDDTVLCIQPVEGHLPESRFECRRLETLSLPDVAEHPTRPAVRRFFLSPVQLTERPPPPVHAGPHVIQGGWWVRDIRRDYRLVGTGGRLLWVFYDHRRQGWFVHGEY